MPIFSLLIVALLTATLGSLWFLVLQLMRQQGRILLRLDELAAAVHQPARAELPLIAREGATGHAPDQPPIGTPVDAFPLEDLDGRLRTLEGLAGERLLLVNWDPACGYCEMLAPDLARLDRELADRGVQLVLLSHGGVDANRNLAQRSNLRCPVLLQPPGQEVSLFRGQGTPIACLLDSEHRVAAPFAVGADAVRALCSRLTERPALPTLKPISESRIERSGLKAGTPAPVFSLPSVTGRTVSLGDFAGRWVLLVFSDPHCGPCDALLPELARLDEAVTDPAIVMVSRGSVEDNRDKVARHGIQFPVLLQPGWRLSREYGSFATPVAFLIDPDGTVVADMATGPEEILLLAAGRKAHNGQPVR